MEGPPLEVEGVEAGVCSWMVEGWLQEEVEVEVVDLVWKLYMCWHSRRSSRVRCEDSQYLSLPGSSSWISGPGTQLGSAVELRDISGPR